MTSGVVIHAKSAWRVERLQRLREVGTAFDCWRAPPSWSVSLRVAVRRGVRISVKRVFGAISLKSFVYP